LRLSGFLTFVNRCSSFTELILGVFSSCQFNRFVARCCTDFPCISLSCNGFCTFKCQCTRKRLCAFKKSELPS